MDKSIQLVYAAYYLHMLSTFNMTQKVEIKDVCAKHTNRRSTYRCRFCNALLCDSECKHSHEITCPNLANVPVCHRSRFDMSKFTEILVSRHPVDRANAFCDPKVIQSAVDDVNNILQSM